MNQDELTQEALEDLENLAEDQNDPIDLYKRYVAQIRDGLRDDKREKIAKINLQ